MMFQVRLVPCALIIVIVCFKIGASKNDDVCDKDSCGKPQFLGNFHIPTKPIPRLPLNDKRAQDRLKKGLPVVLTGSRLFLIDQPWNLEYLERSMRDSVEDWKVFMSDDRRFLYHCDKCNYGNYKWKPAFSWKRMKFQQFVDLFRKLDKENGNKRIYFQSGFYMDLTHDAVFRFNQSALQIIETFGESLGVETTPWFYIGMRDVLTPIHYDYSDNVVVEIHGHKRVIVVSPEHYGDLYPYPRHHPQDRQSQVDLENPDYERFPKLKKVSGYETVLAPGEVLYLPSTWWHTFESEKHSETVSLSISLVSKHEPFRRFAFPESFSKEKLKKDGTVTYMKEKDWKQDYKAVLKHFNKKEEVSMPFSGPLDTTKLIHVKRVIEQLIAEASGSYRQVGPILKELVEGRFDVPFNDDKNDQ